MKPKRYQLKKTALEVVKKRHPWIFRSHLSTAAEVFNTGDLLSLVDDTNEIVGYGIFDREGLIAIRVLKFGATPPSTGWFQTQVKKAIEKRGALRKYTDAFRVIHGENDGFPGVVVELYKDTLVLQSYAASMDRIGRYVVSLVAHALDISNIILKDPQKRVEALKRQVSVRVLRGTATGKTLIREGKHTFTVDIAQGQKTGTFLDLRGLRKHLAVLDLHGKRVLNLFSYTGTLGLMVEHAGAKQIWNVDISKGALDAAKKYHVQDLKRHQFIAADIFHWLEALGAHELFDCIIVDPPNMGTKKEQVPQMMKAYHRLYTLAVKHLNKGGTVVACCCTSRISRRDFGAHVDRCLPRLKCFKELRPEDDHPVSFPEGDYLKIRIYK